MRIRLSALLVIASLAALPAAAQETRGNINGTVLDWSGVVCWDSCRICSWSRSPPEAFR